MANAYGTRIDLAPSDDRPMEDVASVDIMKLPGDSWNYVRILYQGTSFCKMADEVVSTIKKTFPRRKRGSW